MKYKFWDSKEKIMYENNPSFAIGSNGEVSRLIFHECTSECNCDCVEWEGTAYSEHIKSMEYTGLKDDKGNKIYEGDIIQFEWVSSSCWGKAGIYKGYIRFNEGEYELVYINRKNSKVKTDPLKNLLDWSEEIKIIGNIYENPNLLNS